jgi:hypothetical protein
VTKINFSNEFGVRDSRVRGDRSRRTAFRNFGISLVLVATLMLAPGAAMAGGGAGSMAKEAGIGAGSAIASLIYAPIKLAYAAGGLVVGGLAWGFSGGDSNVASIVLTPSLLGDYVVTTNQLSGRQEIEFFGRKPEYRDDDGWDEAPSGDVADAGNTRW